MTQAFVHMLWPLLACFVLVGIHAYLGIHVIARKVIFVDLALAQIAALGAVYGIFIGLSFETNMWAIKAISVGFTLLGAILFAFTRTPDERVPHEAIIGIIYAVALSLTLLLTANLPHGADETRQMLSGNILWVTPFEVIYTAILYSLVGLVHVLFRKQFFWLSNDAALKDRASLSVKWWDFLFYATFGVVVTSSVGIGGVLLVFGYLVIPSVIGVILARSTKMRLLIGWTSGALVSLLGVMISYYFDLPSGPTIVVLLGLLLAVITIILELKNILTRNIGFLHLGALGFFLIILIFIPGWLNDAIISPKHEQKARLHLLTHESDLSQQQIETIKQALVSKNDEEVLAALNNIKEHKMLSLLPDILPLLTDRNDKKRELTVRIIKDLGYISALPHLKASAGVEQDVFLKIAMADAMLSLGDKEGFFILQNIMNQAASDFAREDAVVHMKEWLKEAPANAADLSNWLYKNSHKIKFDIKQKKFYLNNN